MTNLTPRLKAMLEPKRLRRKLEEAKTERLYIQPLLDEALRLYIPKRKQFYKQTPGADNAGDIYDETGANALDEYASRLHAGMTPNFTKFAILEAGPEVPIQDRAAINEDLEQITDYLFEELWHSNFSQEVHECYLDAGISTGNLLVEKGMHGKLLRSRALPMPELYLCPGPHGEIGGVFREREIKASMLPEVYPNADFPEEILQKINGEQDMPIVVVDHIFTDFGDLSTEATIQCSFVPHASKKDEGHVFNARRWTGRGSNPHIGFRFGLVSGEVWGRGPALNTLPAVRTMNTTYEILLQNAALMMIGMYHLDDDSIVNAESIIIEPGAILPRAPNTRGLEPIDMAGRHNFSIEQIILENQAIKIKRGLYNDMLSDPNRTPATAFEVSERMADLAYRMSAHFGRLHYELVTPLMMRILWLAEQEGKIKLPEIKGRQISVRASSPLSAAQGQRDVQSLLQYHSIVTQIAGPQIASGQYDETALFPYLRSRMNTPESIFLSDEEVGQRAAAIAAAQMQGVPGPAPSSPVPPQ